MKNPIPYNSSVYLLKTDVYSRMVIDIGSFPLGSNLIIRPKTIQITTHRSDCCNRRCIATFVYKVVGDPDDEERTLTFRNLYNGRTINLEYDIDSRITDTQSIVTSTLNTLARKLASDIIHKAKSAPRDSLFMTYIHDGYTNVDLWDITHEEILSLEGFNDNITCTRSVTKFHNSRIRKEINFDYTHIRWALDSCNLFCSEVLGGSFVKLSPNIN